MSTASATPTASRARIAVVGLGSIGGVMAGSLAAAGRHALIVCARTPMARMVVERPDGVLDVPIDAITEPADATPVDWVLLCTKAHQSASAADWLGRLCGPATRVVVMQNGIGQAEMLAPYVGGAQVVPTVVYYNGERITPDRWRFRHVGQHELATHDEHGRALADLLAGTSMRVLLSEEFTTLSWRKLLINAVANPFTSLTLQRLSVFQRPDIQALSLAVLEEACAVGRADGARLADDEAARIMATLLTYPMEASASMYFDRVAGRTLEIEALTGAIVARGQRRGIATPRNEMLLTLLRAVSEAAKPV